MNQPDQHPKRHERAMSDAQRARLANVLGNIGTGLGNFAAKAGGAGTEASASSSSPSPRAPEVVSKVPNVELYTYNGGDSAVEVRTGPVVHKMSELMRSTLQPGADGEGRPVMIQATAKRQDGAYENRVAFFDTEAMIAGRLVNGQLLNPKRLRLKPGVLENADPIVGNQPWTLPLSNVNLGRVDAVTVPHTDALINPIEADPTNPSPLDAGQYLLEEFKQTPEYQAAK